MHPSAKIKSNTNYLCPVKPVWISCHGFNYISSESRFKYSLLFVKSALGEPLPTSPKIDPLCVLPRCRLPRRVSTLLSLDFAGVIDLHPSRALIPLSTFWQLVSSRLLPRGQSCASLSDWGWMQLTSVLLDNCWPTMNYWQHDEAVSLWIEKPLWFPGLLLIFCLAVNQ